MFASSVWRSRLTRALETRRVTGCASQTNYLHYHTPSLSFLRILSCFSFLSHELSYISLAFTTPYTAISSNCIYPCGEALDLLRRSQSGVTPRPHASRPLSYRESFTVSDSGDILRRYHSPLLLAWPSVLELSLPDCVPDNRFRR